MKKEKRLDELKSITDEIKITFANQGLKIPSSNNYPHPRRLFTMFWDMQSKEYMFKAVSSEESVNLYIDDSESGRKAIQPIWECFPKLKYANLDHNNSGETYFQILKIAFSDVTDATQFLGTIQPMIDKAASLKDQLEEVLKRDESKDDKKEIDHIINTATSYLGMLYIHQVMHESREQKNGIRTNITSNPNKRPQFQVYYGPPGTGKTKKAKELTGSDERKFKIVQIHPSSSYEDLIEGIKPVTFANGDVKYEVQDGPVKIMAKKAFGSWVKTIVSARLFQDKENKFLLINFPIGTISKWFFEEERFNCRIKTVNTEKQLFSLQNANSDTVKIDLKNSDYDNILSELGFLDNTRESQDKFQEQFLNLEFRGEDWGRGNYVLVLDELNRGNVASILGELVFAISEARGSHPDSEKKKVNLQYSHEPFQWPNNLDLIGTMNSTDISLDRIDQAIKRRFDFISTPPCPEILKVDGYAKNGIDTYLSELNSIIEEEAAKCGAFNVKDKLIGHAMFIPVKDLLKLENPAQRENAIIGNALRDLWEKQLFPALLSIFNGSKEDCEKFVNDHLSKFSPDDELKVIYGWKFTENEALVA